MDAWVCVRVHDATGDDLGVALVPMPVGPGDELTLADYVWPFEIIDVVPAPVGAKVAALVKGAARRAAHGLTAFLRGAWWCENPAMHPSLDGKRFRGAEMSSEGEASNATVFDYHEGDGVVWARYEGGVIRLGFLVGRRDGDRLEFRYSQLNVSDETASGRCSTTISALPDGRLRLDEEWAWETKSGAGSSAVEEIV